MSQIILTPEQVGIFAQANFPIAICHPNGTTVAYISRAGNVYSGVAPTFTPEEIAAAEQILKSDGPWYSTQEVLDHLRTLESK